MTMSRVFLLVVLGTSLIAASGCSDPGLWGREPTDVMNDLSAGRHQFLRNIDPRQLESAPIFALHEGAGYFLGKVYEDLGLPEAARHAYEEQLERDTEPYRREAVMELLSEPWQEGSASARPAATTDSPRTDSPATDSPRTDSPATGDVRMLADVAAEAVSRYPDDEAIVRTALEALYELRRYERFMKVLNDASAGGASSDGATDPGAATEVVAALRGAHPEIMLMEAVARHQLNREGWAPLIRRVFGEFTRRDEHSRLFLYIHNHDDVDAAFSPAEHLLFQGKHALVEGRYRDAAEFYRRLAETPADGEATAGDGGADPAGSLADELPADYCTEALVADMGVAFRVARYYTVGVQLLEETGAILDEPERFAVELARAELLSASGDRSAARRTIEELLSRDPPDRLARRAFGAYLEVLARLEVDRIPFALREHRSLWRAPGAYAAFFDNLTADLVRTRDWFVLTALVEITEANGRGDIAEQYRLALAAALESGLFRPDPESTFATLRGILTPVLDGRRPYYRLMATVLLDEDVPAVLEAMASGAVVAPADDRDRAARVLAEGYLEFGLASRAYALGQEHGRTFPRELTAELSRRAAAEGDLIVSIRLASRIGTSEFDRDVVELRYPLGFAARVDEVVEAHALDRTIFYGVIREESHFSPTIVSHAGAVGLAQLMPSTARDVARRMRLTEYELTDPATNLSIGAYYLAYLRGRFPTYLHALAAYNGGQGRVRRWLSSFDLEGMLFHEAIPLAETRHYIRKIVVSAAYYGYLYDEQSPLRPIELVFPDLQ